MSAASEPSAVFEFFNVSGPENERAKKNNVICSRSEFYKVERTKLSLQNGGSKKLSFIIYCIF